jgi:hypothetical protein
MRLGGRASSFAACPIDPEEMPRSSLGLCTVALLLACGRSAGQKAPPGSDAAADLGVGAQAHDEAGAAAPEGGADAALERATPSPDTGAVATPDAADATTKGDAGDGPAPALVPYRALGVALGDMFACALRDDHSVFCWGTDAPKIDVAPGRTVTSLAADSQKVCAILDDGSVTCWSLSTVTQQTTSAAFALPAGRRALQIGMSGHTTYVLLDDQTVAYASGSLAGVIHRPAGAAAIRQIAPGFEAQLSAVYEDGTYAPELAFGLAKGYLLGSEQAHVLTMAASRHIDFWCYVKVGGGYDCEGGAGNVVPDPAIPLVELVAGTNFLCGRRPDGSVRCWGTFPGCLEGEPSLSYWCDGQKATDHAHDVLLGMPAVSLATNDDLTQLVCAVLVDGSVKCWGGAEVECTGAPGGCQAPAQQVPLIGDTVDIVSAAAGRTYGAWRAVDLGSHP